MAHLLRDAHPHAHMCRHMHVHTLPVCPCLHTERHAHTLHCALMFAHVDTCMYTAHVHSHVYTVTPMHTWHVCPCLGTHMYSCQACVHHTHGDRRIPHVHPLLHTRGDVCTHHTCAFVPGHIHTDTCAHTTYMHPLLHMHTHVWRHGHAHRTHPAPLQPHGVVSI